VPLGPVTRSRFLAKNPSCAAPYLRLGAFRPAPTRRVTECDRLSSVPELLRDPGIFRFYVEATQEKIAREGSARANTLPLGLPAGPLVGVIVVSRHSRASGSFQCGGRCSEGEPPFTAVHVHALSHDRPGAVGPEERIALWPLLRA